MLSNHALLLLSLAILVHYARAQALLTSWMANVPKTTKITQLSIPGLYSVQSMDTLRTSYNQGIRAVDLRLRNYGLTDFHVLQDGVDELSDSHIKLSSVFTETLNFLRQHPTETILFIVRSSAQEPVSDDLLDFLYRYRAYVYADDWSEGVPQIGDMRGKIAFISNGLDFMLEVAPFLEWKNDEGAADGEFDSGAEYWVEDLQTLPQGSFEDTVQSKFDAVATNLQRAYSSENEDDLFISYASVSSTSHYSNMDLMDGIWPEVGLLEKLSASLDQAPISQSTRAGILLLDWNLDPTLINEKLLQPFLTSNQGPLRLQVT